jgi:cysteine desulfurase
MSVLPIYLDYNATTPVDPDVVEAMLPWFSERFGNPSSKRHALGWAADEAVEVAREDVAQLVGADPNGVTFTSGATEALNLAVRGIAAASAHRGRHLITVATEHAGVLEPHRTLERAGFDVTVLPVDRVGRISLDELVASITAETILVSVMWANNETGVMPPVSEIFERTREAGVPLLTDATQAVGKVDVDVRHCDFLAMSAHKFYGPKGVGALVRNSLSRRIRLLPLIEGGGQERGLRGGTLNVPAIVAMGHAARIAGRRQGADEERWRSLRDAFESGLQAELSGVEFFGGETTRLPNTSNFHMAGISADRIIASCRNLALSTGSACASGTGRPSHVIAAMRPEADPVPTTLRVSFGRASSLSEVAMAVKEIRGAIAGIDATRLVEPYLNDRT